MDPLAVSRSNTFTVILCYTFSILSLCVSGAQDWGPGYVGQTEM